MAEVNIPTSSESFLQFSFGIIFYFFLNNWVRSVKSICNLVCVESERLAGAESWDVFQESQC